MTLQEEAYVLCPACGEENVLPVDISVPSQEYTEDCSVCCQPMTVQVTIDEEGNAMVVVHGENE